MVIKFLKNSDIVVLEMLPQYVINLYDVFPIVSRCSWSVGNPTSPKDQRSQKNHTRSISINMNICFSAQNFI